MDEDEHLHRGTWASIEQIRQQLLEQLASGDLTEGMAQSIEARLQQLQKQSASGILSERSSSLKQAPEGVEYVPDVSPAQWVQNSLRNFWTVRGMMPEGFPAYARLFHPAYVGEEMQPIRWSKVASWTGRTAHPLMSFARIANLSEDVAEPDPPWGEHPSGGSIPIPECRMLIDLFRGYTDTPDRCWFGVWEGNGYINPRLYRPARVKAPHRDHLLFRGPLESVMKFLEGDPGFRHYVSPSIWWPDDRAWCVATDVDLPHSYVGGSEECIEALLARPELEALPARLDDAVYDDTINAPYGSAEDATG